MTALPALDGFFGVDTAAGGALGCGVFEGAGAAGFEDTTGGLAFADGGAAFAAGGLTLAGGVAFATGGLTFGVGAVAFAGGGVAFTAGGVAFPTGREAVAGPDINGALPPSSGARGAANVFAAEEDKGVGRPPRTDQSSAGGAFIKRGGACTERGLDVGLLGLGAGARTTGVLDGAGGVVVVCGRLPLATGAGRAGLAADGVAAFGGAAVAADLGLR